MVLDEDELQSLLQSLDVRIDSTHMFMNAAAVPCMYVCVCVCHLLPRVNILTITVVLLVGRFVFQNTTNMESARHLLRRERDEFQFATAATLP